MLQHQHQHPSVSKAEEAGERTAGTIKEKVAHVSARARATKERVVSDEKLRKRLLVGSAGAAALGVLFWQLWKKRDKWCPACKEQLGKAKEKVTEAKDKLQAKVAHLGGGGTD